VPLVICNLIELINSPSKIRSNNRRKTFQ